MSMKLKAGPELQFLFDQYVGEIKKQAGVNDDQIADRIKRLRAATVILRNLEFSDAPLWQTLQSRDLDIAIGEVRVATEETTALLSQAGILDMVEKHLDECLRRIDAKTPDEVELKLLEYLNSPDPRSEWEQSFVDLASAVNQQVFRNRLNDVPQAIVDTQTQLKTLLDDKRSAGQPTRRVDKWLKGLGKIARGAGQGAFNLWLATATPTATIEILAFTVAAGTVSAGVVIPSCCNAVGLLVEGIGELWPVPK
jgi:hypothetical protein